MSKLLGPVKAVITPEMVESAAAKLGLPKEQVVKGAEFILPLIATGLSRIVATPEGQVALMKAINDADTGVLGSLTSFIDGLSPESGADLVQRLLGDDARVVVGQIKEQTGLNIVPVLGMVGPMVLGYLNSQVRQKELDTTTLVKEVKNAARSYDRSKDDNAAIVATAFKAADDVRAIKGQLNADEWHIVQAAPLAATSRVIAASPSKTRETERELAAAVAVVSAAGSSAPLTSLLAALFAEHATAISAADLSDTLGVLAQAVAAVGRVSPDELAAYRDLIVAASEAAAREVKEGGFMGIGRKEVSPAEQAALDEIKAAVGAA